MGRAIGADLAGQRSHCLLRVGADKYLRIAERGDQARVGALRDGRGELCSEGGAHQRADQCRAERAADQPQKLHHRRADPQAAAWHRRLNHDRQHRQQHADPHSAHPQLDAEP